MNYTLARSLATVLVASSLWFGAQSCTLLADTAEKLSGQIAAPPPIEQASQLPSSQLPSSLPSAPIQQGPTLQEFSNSIRVVAEQVRPAVVQITTRSGPSDLTGEVEADTGVGSGVIYDPTGYILTNNHVVAGGEALLVALPDGRTFDGSLVGGDPQTDLAVLKIQGDNLPVARLGDSDQMKVGDWVVAIGNALGLPGGPTVTVGVVSALNRTVQEPGDGDTSPSGPFLYDMIQTDASINPGNSGGALVNLNGEVVGINTMIAGAAGPGIQAQGIGFAISVNGAKPIAQQLVSSGRVVHPFLGVRYTALTPSSARQLGIQGVQNGLVVMRVVPGSPAERAGVKELDVIVKVNNQPIEQEGTLGRVLSAHKPGDVVSLDVQRGGKTEQIRVTLGERPPDS